MRDRQSSTQAEAVGTAVSKTSHFPHSPERLSSLGLAKEARGEILGMATGRADKGRQVKGSQTQERQH